MEIFNDVIEHVYLDELEYIDTTHLSNTVLSDEVNFVMTLLAKDDGYFRSLDADSSTNKAYYNDIFALYIGEGISRLVLVDDVFENNVFQYIKLRVSTNHSTGEVFAGYQSEKSIDEPYPFVEDGKYYLVSLDTIKEYVAK